ncbi:MAG: acyl-CoA dehydrogenase family protein [Dehalococcoidia bacterium]|nr:acyl-CoA dehydrogenase family protein [Dehalococcoidia bacterium]
MVSFNPSEDQQMIVNMVKQFATDEMRKVYRQSDENGEIPGSIIDKAWGMGFVSSAIPEKYGGAGEERSVVTTSLLAEELAWGDLSMTMHILSPSLFAVPVLLAGTEEQKAKYLPAFCGNKFYSAAAALMEPRFNFDANALVTKAERNNGSYILNGNKCFVPLAVDAAQILVYASEAGVTQGFIVEKGTAGLKISEREKNMGIKALATYELTLENCKVPAENKLGGEKGCDFNLLLNCSRVALSSMAVGVAKAAFEYSRDYARTRVAFGEPIASRQAIAFMLAEMAIEIDATRLMAWEAAWLLDKKKDAAKEAYLLKNYADDMVLMVADRAVQILGGHGYVREHPVELWFRNGRGFTTFDGMAIV